MLNREELLAQVKQGIREIQAGEVRRAMEAGERLLLVDVRERDEVAEGHLPGAALIPRGMLEMSVEEEVTADRDEPIVLYCAAGHRSALAARDLGAMGYRRVSSMRGGFRAWKAAGFPVTVPRLLSDGDRQRYARHLLLPEVGEAGQLKLAATRVLLVGVGGLGCPAGLYLAAAGVGALGLIDADVVDRSNLQRQVLFGEASLGRPKVDAARQRLLDLNPGIAVEPYQQRLSSDNALGLFAGYDLVLNACDNFPTRYLVNDAAVLSGKPVVDGSIFRFEGQVTVFHPGRGPCYRCLYPEPPPPGEMPSCAEAGVLGVLPGVVGLLQATEAIKLIVGVGNPLVGRMLIYDALEPGFRELRLRRNPECPVCGDHPTVTGLIDYEGFCGIPGRH
jgi:adenylyltransferase/sulfurtransferase